MQPSGLEHVRRSEFEALSRRTYQRVYNLAFRLTGNMVDAEDLTQDAFVRGWRSFDTYDRSRPFETWLLRILSNLAIDRWRRKPPAAICSLDELDETSGIDASLGSRLPDRSPGPEHLCIRSVMSEKMDDALGVLPPVFREAIILADVEARTYEEVAREMQCPVGTVRSRLHRGHLELRKRLSSPSLALSD